MSSGWADSEWRSLKVDKFVDKFLPLVSRFIDLMVSGSLFDQTKCLFCFHVKT